VFVDDVPHGASEGDAAQRLRLLMLVNDVSLRNLIPAELTKGFGFCLSKPATAFSPVAVIPDELGPAWRDGKVHLPLTVHVNGRLLGRPNCGTDMTLNFSRLVAHAATTRRLGAGAIVGSGTVSNYDRSRGSACLAEVRMLATQASGAPRTPSLEFGATAPVAMEDADGNSIFGAIEQQVVARPKPVRQSLEP
jgi:fumarylacetoacetate (FAA) hydrolase